MLKIIYCLNILFINYKIRPPHLERFDMKILDRCALSGIYQTSNGNIFCDNRMKLNCKDCHDILTAALIINGAAFFSLLMVFVDDR